MAEERLTSATGGQKGQKPERHDLIPRPFVRELALVYGYGAKKYADNNWRKGYPWSWSFAALMRHVYRFAAGERYDVESGLHHLAHAAFHLAALFTFSTEGGTNDVEYEDLDDLYDGWLNQRIDEWEKDHG